MKIHIITHIFTEPLPNGNSREISWKTYASVTETDQGGMIDAIIKLAAEYDTLRMVHPDPEVFERRFQLEVNNCHYQTTTLAQNAIGRLLPKGSSSPYQANG